MNRLEIYGKVLNCYITDHTETLVMRIADVHKHNERGIEMDVESVYNVIMTDPKKIEKVEVQQGDIVRIDAHIKMYKRYSGGGNTHETLKVYADEVEVVNRKDKARFVDTTRISLGM